MSLKSDVRILLLGDRKFTHVRCYGLYCIAVHSIFSLRKSVFHDEVTISNIKTVMTTACHVSALKVTDIKTTIEFLLLFQKISFLT